MRSINNAEKRRDALVAESGYTLVELLVYSLLLVVVLTIVGAMLINLITVERQVRETTAATTAAQQAADTIANGVRNSRAFFVQDTGLLGSGDELLLATTAGTGDPVSWHCRAWYFSAAEGSLRYMRMVAPDTPVPLPTDQGELTGSWTLLAGDVRTTDSGIVFGNVGRQVTTQFETFANDNTATTIRSSALSRAGQWESEPCF
jgi:type II secretory pathway pseudopilin PulG